MSKEPALEFKTLSQGLGFHPQTQSSNTSAPATPIRPRLPDRPTLPNIRPNFSTGSGAVAAGKPRFAQALPPVVLTKAAPVFPETNPSLVLLVKRVCAYALDTAANLGVCLSVLFLLLWQTGIRPSLLFQGDGFSQVLVGLFLFLFNWAVITAQEVAFSTSLGKRSMGLVMTGAPLSIFLRSILFLPSFFFGGIGLFWGVFDSHRRLWHDVMTEVHIKEIIELPA